MHDQVTDWRRLHGDCFDGVRVLVTGGAGFIGSHLTEALLSLGATVVVLDDLSGGSVDNFSSFRKQAGDRLIFVQGSILDPSTLSDCMAGCRHVFHQAALGSVPRSLEEPETYVQVNMVGTFNVLEHARRHDVKRVMFAASSSAYGDTETLPKTESMPVQPCSPYAASKAAGEALMRAYSHSYGLDAVSLRYFNIFGPRQNANSAYAAVIAAFAKDVLADTPPTVHGDGRQSRDFTFVDNAVHANLLAARKTESLDGKIINVGCGRRVTVDELARITLDVLGKPHLSPKHVPERPGDVRHSLADLTQARQLLGYEPIVHFESGLQPTLDWYRSVLR